MIVLDPGHKYQLAHLDGYATEILTFVKRKGEKYPGNTSSYEGTNLQEVMRAIINRVKYLNNQVKDSRNFTVLDAMKESIWALECRAAERHNRFDEFIREYDLSLIETYSTCDKCGHIGCFGRCH